MNSNNPPPYICPWHPGVSVPPHQWDRSEQNRINALHKKQRYSFPPSLSSTPFIQPVPPAWNNISYQLPFACQLDTLTPNVVKLVERGREGLRHNCVDVFFVWGLIVYF